MNDDMILNMDNFDFSMLDEGFGEAEPKASAKDEPEEFDFSDVDFDEEDYDSEEAEDEEEYEDDEDDEDDTEEEQEADPSAGDLDLLNDDEEVKLGETVLTKAELKDVLGRKEAITKQSDSIRSFIAKTEVERKEVEALMFSSMSETTQRIRAIDEALRDPNYDVARKGELVVAKQKLEAKEVFLKQNNEKYKKLFEEREASAVMENLKNLEAEMVIRHPDWSTNNQKVAEYAKSTGIDPIAFLKIATPDMMDVIIKAMKYDKSLEKTKREVKETKKATKPAKVPRSKGSSASRPARKPNNAREANMLRRFKNGKANHTDFSDIFEFLVD